MTDDREVDRKADPDAGKPPEEAAIDSSGDRRDIHEAGRHLREWIAGRLPAAPDVSIYGVTVAALYAATVAGGLAVAYGTIAIAAAYGGTHAAVVVGGAFATVYGYVGLSAVSRVKA